MRDDPWAVVDACVSVATASGCLQLLGSHNLHQVLFMDARTHLFVFMRGCGVPGHLCMAGSYGFSAPDMGPGSGVDQLILDIQNDPAFLGAIAAGAPAHHRVCFSPFRSASFLHLILLY